METGETPQHHGGIVNYFQGATIHNMVINGNMSKNGTENYSGNAEKTEPSYSDEQVATALANIVGRGKPIDAKWKWAGAIWLLQWVCNYPSNARMACERINQLPLPEGLEYACDYRNVREVTTLPFLNEDARHIERVKYSKNDEGVFLEMKKVVKALGEELKKTIDYKPCANM